jgi:diguanylate cyclase (GGDEF)-like protein
VTAAGSAVTAAVVGLALAHGQLHLDGRFAALTALALLVGLRPLTVTNLRDEGGADLAVVFLFSIALTYGAGPALAANALVCPVIQRAKGRAPWRVAFNVAQYSLSYAAAGALAGRLGIDAGLGAAQLPAAALAGLALFVVNYVAVTIAVALHERVPLPSSLRADLGYHLAVGGAMLSLSPLVAVTSERGVWLVALLLPAVAVVNKVGEVTVAREHQATHDSLTGLPNRALLLSRAATALSGAAGGGHRVAMFLLDLDRFKQVNDTYGHHAGDRLLVVVGARLRRALRPGDTVARLGGDEFAVLLPGLSAGPGGIERALEVAERVRAALRDPYEIDGSVVEVDASVGVAIYPDHGADVGMLLRRADMAMYQAKERGRGVGLYRPAARRRNPARLLETAELAAALANAQLELHYQPQAEMADGRVPRVEALARWQHPLRGLLLPDVFVPLAVTGGLIRAMTTWALGAALDQIALWHTAGVDLGVSVNASGPDMRDPAFATSVAAALTARGLPARALTVEVTEAIILAGADGVDRCLRDLATLGVGVSLDDFGAGASSLAALRRLPFSEIKVDRTIVRGLETNTTNARFVRAIIRLGHELGLRVVAEGVETAGERARLAGYGCDAVQGWHVAPVLPAALLPGWLYTQSHTRSRERRAAGRGAGLAAGPPAAASETAARRRAGDGVALARSGGADDGGGGGGAGTKIIARSG